MKISIIGASGKVGSELTRLLAEQKVSHKKLISFCTRLIMYVK